MKYIQFDEQNVLSARFDSDIHGENIPFGAVETVDDLFWRTINEKDGVWRLDPVTGEIAKHPFAPPTPEQVQAQKVAIVQAYMDEAARAHRYDDIKTAVTYADEPIVLKFQAEGQTFRAWRSQVWETCYAILDEVSSGARSVPTDEELIASLPILSLPPAS